MSTAAASGQCEALRRSIYATQLRVVLMLLIINVINATTRPILITNPFKSRTITFNTPLMQTTLQFRLGSQVHVPKLQLPQIPKELHGKSF